MVNLLFLSDGERNRGGSFDDEIDELENTLDVNLYAFGTGEDASLEDLQVIDPNAKIFTSTNQLLDVFNNLSSDPINVDDQGFIEPGLAGVTIYLDLNNNGALDASEPFQITDAAGNYEFTDLAPGTYIVRELVPDGFTQTFPFGAPTTSIGDGFADVILDYFNSGTGSFTEAYGSDNTGNFPVTVDPEIILGGDDLGSLSLPTGSFVTVGFTDEVIIDDPGDDIFIPEVGPNGEQADVFVSSDSENFVFLGTGNGGQTSSFDLASINFTEPVQAVKIVGLDDDGGSPGFDVINVQGLPGSIASNDFHIVEVSNDDNIEGIDFGNLSNAPQLPDFMGADIQLDGFSPNFETRLLGPAVATVNDEIEFISTEISTNPSVVDNTLDIDANSITYAISDAETFTQFASGDFNGYVLTDILDAVPDIENVTINLDETSSSLEATEVFFTEDTVSFSLAGLSFNPGDILKLDVDFALAGDDNYESNDILTTAYDLSAFENTWLETIDGLGQQFDDDWYKITVLPGQQDLTIDLDFIHAEGDIDVALYDDNQNFITSSTSVTDDEQLTAILPTAGDYYIQVYYGNTGNSYDLRWTTNEFIDDAYEVNNTQATAYDLSENEQTWLEDLSGLGIAGNDDWYKININSGFEHLLVDLDFTHDDGDLELSLYDVDGNYVTGRFSSTDDEQLEAVLPSTGDYYLKVEAAGDYRGNSYDLWWDDLRFDDDAYEDNNTLATAYNLSSDERTWLEDIFGLGVAGDDDWYQIEVTSGYERLVVDLDFMQDEGNLNLSLYDVDGNYVTGAFSSTDNEYLETILPSAGTYFLQVEVSGDYVGNSYNLWWDDLSFEEDNYEVNNTLATAYDLSNDEQTWLTNISGFGISGDEDWYKVDITPGYENLVVDLQFTHNDLSDLNLELYDANGNYVTEAFSSSDDETLNTIVPNDGTYYLKVFTYDNYIGQVYDLKWDDLAVVDDAYEENDQLLGAYDISTNVNTWLSDLSGAGIANDEDWYEITIESGAQQLVSDLRFIHSNGDLELGLYDSDSTYITGSTSFTDNEQINTVLADAGTYYLNVNQVDGSGNTYDLRWQTF